MDALSSKLYVKTDSCEDIFGVALLEFLEILWGCSLEESAINPQLCQRQKFRVVFQDPVFLPVAMLCVFGIRDPDKC